MDHWVEAAAEVASRPALFPNKIILGGNLRSHSDLLLPAAIGSVELFAAPILIATEAWSVVGAWIAFKAFAQWGTWKERRSPYNHFLLGNALMVVFSYILAVLFVKVTYLPADASVVV